MNEIRLSLALAAIVAVQAACQQTPGSAWQSAVQRAARKTPDARIIVLEITADRVLAAHHFAESAHTLAAPGSTLKPLVLYQLLSTSHWNPDRRVACDRNLVVTGHRLACTHPPALPFNAREALAWSCNTYFAQVARTLAPGQLGRLLRATGLLSPTGLVARNTLAEAVADFREPANPDAQQLALLGVDGIRVTPLELAAAYRWLAKQIAASPDSSASQVISAGLADSASFGMARSAGERGASVAGKTGTAEGRTTAQAHGWFAGLSPVKDPQVVIVVYLPSGRGADAARVAADLLERAPRAGHE